MIDKWLDQHTNSLDADVFTGDCLDESENRDFLKKMCERWLREIKRWEER